MYNATIKTEDLVNKICGDFANIGKKMDKCRMEYLEAIENGEESHAFFVGNDFALSLAIEREFSEFHRVEHDDDNHTVIVYFNEFPEEISEN